MAKFISPGKALIVSALIFRRILFWQQYELHEWMEKYNIKMGSDYRFYIYFFSSGNITPCGQRTVRHQRNIHLLTDWNQLTLILTIQEIIMIFHSGKFCPSVLFGYKLHIVKLVTIHSRSAKCPHLTDLYQIMQPTHSFEMLISVLPSLVYSIYSLPPNTGKKPYSP